MKPFVKEHGIVGCLDRANVDTDQIIPKQFLKRIERTGFGQYLFFDWRFKDDGSDNPEFELNQPAAKGATILLARRNFGCGSSREHAVWALEDYGLRTVLAPSFADIFFSNCFKNGILPVVLPAESVAVLIEDAKRGANARITVDLETQTVTASDGQSFAFDVDAHSKHCLMHGLDDIGLTLEKASAIDAYEERSAILQPWA